MGTTIEIYIPTLVDKEIEGIVADLIQFLKQYAYDVSLKDIHKTWRVE